MPKLRKTAAFEAWFLSLRDSRAKGRILARLRRLELGNPGDVAPVGEGISEMKIDYGPGYRFYFQRTTGEVLLLLYGGDKTSQAQDIRYVKLLAKEDWR